MTRIGCALIASLAVQACRQVQPPTPAAPVTIDAQLERALSSASEGRGSQWYRLPSSDDFDAIPQDPKNPITREKVELGGELFHETALGMAPKVSAGTGTYSCASCHNARAGFQAGRPQGIGEGGVGFGEHGEARMVDPTYPIDSIDVQQIRAPSTLNIAYQPNVMWNGGLGATGVNEGTKYAWMPNTPLAFNRLGLEGVETLSVAALGVHRMSPDVLLDAYPAYREAFDRAFPELPAARRYTRRATGSAIAAYLRTLLSNEAPFQRWLRGDRTAMSEAEKRGALLFFGKARCSHCHNGPALSSPRFEVIGMKDLYDNPSAVNATPDSIPNLGRGGFTGRMEQLYAFKVPQLYNLADSPFYGHGASFTSLADVVRYKNIAKAESRRVPQRMLSPEFRPLGLTETEIDDLTSFLSIALRDPRLDRYVPSMLPSEYCFPNNDVRSRTDLGCGQPNGSGR